MPVVSLLFVWEIANIQDFCLGSNPHTIAGRIIERVDSGNGLRGASQDR